MCNIQRKYNVILQRCGHVALQRCHFTLWQRFSQRCKNNLLTTLCNIVFRLCLLGYGRAISIYGQGTKGARTTTPGTTTPWTIPWGQLLRGQLPRRTITPVGQLHLYPPGLTTAMAEWLKQVVHCSCEIQRFMVH